MKKPRKVNADMRGSYRRGTTRGFSAPPMRPRICTVVQLAEQRVGLFESRLEVGQEPSRHRAIGHPMVDR